MLIDPAKANKALPPIWSEVLTNIATLALSVGDLISSAWYWWFPIGFLPGAEILHGPAQADDPGVVAARPQEEHHHAAQGIRRETTAPGARQPGNHIVGYTHHTTVDVIETTERIHLADPLQRKWMQTLILGNRDDIDERRKWIPLHIAHESDMLNSQGVFINPALVEPFGLTIIEVRTRSVTFLWLIIRQLIGNVNFLVCGRPPLMVCQWWK